MTRGWEGMVYGHCWWGEKETSPEGLWRLTQTDAADETSTPGRQSSRMRTVRDAPRVTRRWPDVGLMLGQRRKRWPSINPTLGQRLVLAGVWDGIDGRMMTWKMQPGRQPRTISNHCWKYFWSDFNSGPLVLPCHACLRAVNFIFQSRIN